MEKERLVLCDTNVIIEFYKENKEVIDVLKNIGQDNIALSIVTAGELLYGALNKKELKQISKDISLLHILNINLPKSKLFIKLMDRYVLSHKLNLPDGLIAATAIEEDIPLYTLNLKDFNYIEELRLYNIK
jgi:predicted nucleic acid-binding protein